MLDNGKTAKRVPLLICLFYQKLKFRFLGDHYGIKIVHCDGDSSTFVYEFRITEEKEKSLRVN